MTLADLYYEMLDMVALTVIVSALAFIMTLVLLAINIVILRRLKKISRRASNTANRYPTNGCFTPNEMRDMHGYSQPHQMGSAIHDPKLGQM